MVVGPWPFTQHSQVAKVAKVCLVVWTNTSLILSSINLGQVTLAGLLSGFEDPAGLSPLSRRRFCHNLPMAGGPSDLFHGWPC